jgi:hypothetical protein
LRRIRRNLNFDEALPTMNLATMLSCLIRWFSGGVQESMVRLDVWVTPDDSRCEVLSLWAQRKKDLLEAWRACRKNQMPIVPFMRLGEYPWQVGDHWWTCQLILLPANVAPVLFATKAFWIGSDFSLNQALNRTIPRLSVLLRRHSFWQSVVCAIFFHWSSRGLAILKPQLRHHAQSIGAPKKKKQHARITQRWDFFGRKRLFWMRRSIK